VVGAGILAAALTVSLGGCAFVDVSLFQPAQPLKEKVLEGEGPGKVLVVEIGGVITYEDGAGLMDLRERINPVARVKEVLQRAARDPEVEALVLRIYSPGGTVSACDVLHHELEEFKEGSGVKVVASLSGVATSGAYYIATAADHIVAQPTTLTGSIGAIAIKLNVQGLLDKVGIEPETVKSGEMKDIWSPLRPATEKEHDIFEAIISEYEEKFLEVIRRGRPGFTERDATTVRDGRIVSGRQALGLHLVDRIGYLDDAVQWARDVTGLPHARVVRYYRPGSYVDNVYSRSEVQTWNWPGSIRRQALRLHGLTGQFMYLWLP
jgi:protease-4